FSRRRKHSTAKSGSTSRRRKCASCRCSRRTPTIEAKRRWDAKMTAGQAAADITLGKFDNWIGPERIVMDTVRFYMEFDGTLVPDVNNAGIRAATEEYNRIKATKKTAGVDSYEEPYDERV